MELDLRTCARARLTRDARFDGRIFIGVRTTRIYCRPICTSPKANEQNVRYFPSAAAAHQAGFRPCLRCRPECAPGTPLGNGMPGTLSRALRLMAENGPGNADREALAGRLGVEPRDLRRMFVQHLGATPRAVAQTRRLHFAKRLIDETDLPMGRLALAAGFGSVRQFNAAIRQVYRRTPTAIRRLARRTIAPPRNEYLFRLHFRPPYHWDGMLAFLSPRATPGVEAVRDGTYYRSIDCEGEHGWLAVSALPGEDALAVRIGIGDPCLLFRIIERVRAMFDLNADCTAVAHTLAGDPVLAARTAACPGLRIPGCWNSFELAVRAILGQQITVKGATALAGRLVQAYGQPSAGPCGVAYVFPPPEVLARASLTGIGLTGKRAETIRRLARAICDRRISFDNGADSERLLHDLCEIPGIGTWTAQYVAMRALGEPDALPSGDLGMLRALGLRHARELESRAETWRPWRAYAAIYLWTGSHAPAGGGTQSVFTASL
ncbi:MAG TPA: AlkA N-terminal domain-containing protein [Bryobacteraceae bacterium]|nr:AlkA N-terminal domain-containing protein [Bryobacteraceae bacterium]